MRRDPGSNRKAGRLKLPRNVKAYTSKGIAYFYFRGTSVRLPGLPWSPEFMDVHAAMMAQRAAPGAVVIGAKRTTPGSINAAIVGYYQSAAFVDGLAASTQGWRRRCLEKFRADFGDVSLRKFEKRHAQRFMSLIAKAGSQRNMGQALSHFGSYCVDAALIAESPFEGVKRAKMKKSGGIAAWTEDHVAKFEAHHPKGSKARLALALYLNFGVRKSDVVRIGPRHIQGGELTDFQPQKTARTGGNTITVPLTDETKAAILATPVTGADTYLVNEWGKAFTANGFGNKMRQWCDEAGLPDCSSHGLRKLCLIRLAELGLNTETIMAISGHKNRAEIDTYVAAFNRKKLARQAMAAVEKSATQREQQVSNSVVQLDKSGKK